jgi:hypothetical protein
MRGRLDFDACLRSNFYALLIVALAGVHPALVAQLRSLSLHRRGARSIPGIKLTASAS